MLPDVADEVLLAELRVVVSTGWDLPAHDERASQVRQLLLMTPVDSSHSFRQAAHRLLIMIDDALRAPDDEVLGSDVRVGCRILLGTHPDYRTEGSPTVRREAAARYLVPGWNELRRHRRPSDVAGTFQRRHQAAVLRQVLECLRQTFGQTNDELERDYDVVSIKRWCQIDANRQTTQVGETLRVRARVDGLSRLDVTEPLLAEGVLEAAIRVVPDADDVAATFDREEGNPTRPGERVIWFDLHQYYSAGDQFELTWHEDRTIAPDAPRWSRDWLAVSAPNDAYTLDVSVHFAGGSVLPGVVWWYAAHPLTDMDEIGPTHRSRLVDVGEFKVARHSWAGAETVSWFDYGILWVWLDDSASRRRWESARRKLESSEAAAE